MAYTLIGTIENAIGGTLQWKVLQAVGTCDYAVDDILTPTGSTTINASPYVTSVEVEFDPEMCQDLIIGLFVTIDGEVCQEFIYSLDGNVDEHYHYECIDTETPFCGIAVGAYDPENPDHFFSISDCQACVSCPCTIGEDPCDDIAFTAVHVCTTNPADNNEIQLCLTLNETGGDVTITNIIVITPTTSIPLIDAPIVINGTNCTTIEPITALPNGTYYVTLLVETDICPLTPVSMLVNCGDGPPTVSACCTSLTPESDGNNVAGDLICQVINLEYLNGDNSQPLILDFGCNNVADKFEVFNGVVDCALMYQLPHPFEANLIASTSYIGALSGNNGSCLNIEPCFVRAQAGDTAPILQGFQIFTGVYPCTPGPGCGAVIEPDILTLTPAYHFTQTCSTPLGVDCGGPIAGQGRLIIPALSYGSEITIVAHGNAAIGQCLLDCQDCIVNTPTGPACANNGTAWRYYLHCPDCGGQECTIVVKTPGYTCTNQIGGIVFGVDSVAYDPIEPVTIAITPQLPLTLTDLGGLLGGYGLVTDGIGGDYWYPLELIDIDGDSLVDSIGFQITDDLTLAGYALYFAYVADGSLVPINVPSGAYAITAKDSVGCIHQSGVYLDCACEPVLASTYDPSFCSTEEINITITGTGFPCNLYGNHTITGTLPTGLIVTGNGSDELIISGTPDVPGGTTTVTVNVSVTCGDCTTDIDIEFDIYNPDCVFSAIITPEACLSHDGEIEIEVTACDALLPIDWISSHGGFGTIMAYPTTISEISLVAGTYIYSFEDANGCTWTQTFVVPTIGGPSITDIDDIEIDCSVRVVSDIDVTITGGTGPFTVNIEKPLGVNVASEVGAGPTVTILTGDVTGGFVPGTYYVNVEDSLGCFGSTSFTITKTPSPDFILSPTYTYCEQHNGIIVITGITNVVDTENMTIYYGDGISCGALGTSIGSTIIDGLAADTYTVCIVDNSTECCTCKTVTITNLGASIAPPLAAVYEVCEDETVSMVANCASGVARWRDEDGNVVYNGSPFYVTPTEAMTFTVDCYNTTTGCHSTDVEISVTINEAESVVSMVSHVCPGSTVPIVFADALTGCTGTIQWYYGTTPITAQTTFPSWGTATPTGAGLSLTNITSSVTLNYTCTSVDGCVSTGYGIVVLKPKPVVNVQPVTACIGSTINLNSALVSIDEMAPLPPGYIATFYDYQPLTSCVTPSCTGPSISSIQPVSAGIKTYKVKITAPNGCTTCKCFTISGAPAPAVTVTANNPCQGGTLTLTGSPNIVGATYAWTFTPTVGPTVALPNITYNINIPAATSANNGTYTLTVTSGVGCVGSGSVVVSVLPQDTISVPNETNCVNTGSTNSLTIGGSNNNLYTWEYVSGPQNIMNGVQGTAYPSISYTTVALDGTYVYTICSTGACPACDQVTIVLSKVANPKLSLVCHPATWNDLFTFGPTVGNTYYWSSSALATCSSGTWSQIVNFGATIPAIGTIYIKTENAAGCCIITSVNTVTALPTMAEHHVTCNPSNGPTTNTGNILFDITPVSLPQAYYINITGVNLADGSTTTLPQFLIPANNTTIFQHTQSNLSTGTWIFTGYITIQLTGIVLDNCPFTLEVDVACCPNCQSSWQFDLRYVHLAESIGPNAIAVPLQLQKSIVAPYNVSALLPDTYTLQVDIYNNAGVLQDTITTSGIEVGVDTVDISSSGLADGTYQMMLTCFNGLNIISRVRQLISISVGGTLYGISTAGLLDIGNFLEPETTIEPCGDVVIVTRYDGEWNLGQSDGIESIITCTSGIAPPAEIEFPYIVNYQIPFRLEYACNTIDCAQICSLPLLGIIDSSIIMDAVFTCNG
jgi:hypothetical protein